MLCAVRRAIHFSVCLTLCFWGYVALLLCLVRTLLLPPNCSAPKTERRTAIHTHVWVRAFSRVFASLAVAAKRPCARLRSVLVLIGVTSIVTTMLATTVPTCPSPYCRCSLPPSLAANIIDDASSNATTNYRSLAVNSAFSCRQNSFHNMFVCQRRSDDANKGKNKISKYNFAKEKNMLSSKQTFQQSRVGVAVCLRTIRLCASLAFAFIPTLEIRAPTNSHTATANASEM